jgi:lysophospholipase L1-like esterase
MKTNTVVMIGDSITEGFNTKKYFPNDIVVNKGVSGDSTVECLDRISSAWFTPVPNLVFICIGTNDFARDRTDQFVLTNTKTIIEKVRQFAPESKIFLTSIFPTRENAPRPNERITDYNRQLKKLSDNLGILYFDIHSHFVDEEGMLKKEFTEDGLHLTEEGYKNWSNVLSALLYTKT